MVVGRAASADALKLRTRHLERPHELPRSRTLGNCPQIGRHQHDRKSNVRIAVLVQVSGCDEANGLLAGVIKVGNTRR